MDRPWTRFYEPGVRDEVLYPEGTLVQHLLEQAAARFPTRPATILPTKVRENLYGGRVSYRDLDNAANRFANGLGNLGVKKGDRIALILPNCPQFLISYFGAMKVGAIVVPFNHLYTPQEIERQLLDCGAESVVTSRPAYPAVKQVQANTLVTRVIVTRVQDYIHPVLRLFFNLSLSTKGGPATSADPRDYSFRQLLRRSQEGRPDMTIDSEDLALLQYPPDARGRFKGAELTHRNIVSNCMQSAAWNAGSAPGDQVVLCVVPFSHPLGHQIALLNSVLTASSLIMFSTFEIEDILMSIEKYRVTVFPSLAGLYHELLDHPAIAKYDLRSVHTSISTDHLVPPTVLKDWETRTGGRLLEGFGVAEAGPLTLANPLQGERRDGSIGIPVPGTFARIVDPSATNVEQPVGQRGRLAIKGPQVFRGYWNRPDETCKTLQEGWLVTDNYAHTDQDGFFYLVENGKL